MPNALPNFDARIGVGKAMPAKVNRPDEDRYLDGLGCDRWRRLRLRVLRAEPTCRACKAIGRVTPASEVDHILPRRERPELTYEVENLQPLCKPCHSRKTRREQELRRKGGMPFSI